MISLPWLLQVGRIAKSKGKHRGHPKLRTRACDRHTVPGGTAKEADGRAARNDWCVCVCGLNFKKFRVRSTARTLALSSLHSFRAMATDPLRGIRKILPAPVATAVLLFKGTTRVWSLCQAVPLLRPLVLAGTTPFFATSPLTRMYPLFACHFDVQYGTHSIGQPASSVLPRTFRR